VSGEVFDLFPILRQFLRRRGGDLSGGQQQQLAIARALCARPRLLILDEPTEGNQPSVIKDIARVIRHLSRDRGMAVILVEQYYDFARELADRITVMVRGEVALAGAAGELDEPAVRRLLTV
jgi:urea transport system ATP-binding protein